MPPTECQGSKNHMLFANGGGIAPDGKLAVLEVPHSNQRGIPTHLHMQTCTHAWVHVLMYGAMMKTFVVY